MTEETAWEPVEVLEPDPIPALPNGFMMVQEQRGVARGALDQETDAFAAALSTADTNRKALLSWIRDNLVDGTPACYFTQTQMEKARTKNSSGYWVDNPRYMPELHATKPGDFGRIYTQQGWSKPSLWKSGAEKILGMLRMVPTWPDLEKYVEAALSGNLPGSIVLRCKVMDGFGRVVAEGIGSALIGDDLNKGLKMAKKSSLIDACLACAGISELFTQDLDEVPASAVAALDQAPAVAQGPPGSRPAGASIPFGRRAPPIKDVTPKSHQPVPEPAPAPDPDPFADKEPLDTDAVSDYITRCLNSIGYTHAQGRLLMVTICPELKRLKGGGFTWKDLDRAQAGRIADALEAMIEKQTGGKPE